MSITRGAKKAHRQSLRRRTFNAARKSKISQSVKKFKKLVVSGDKKSAQAMMPEVQKAYDKAVKAKTLKKNTAARKKSQLVKLLKKV